MDSDRPNSGGHAHTSEDANIYSDDFIMTEEPKSTSLYQGHSSPSSPFAQHGNETRKSPLVYGKQAAAFVQSNLKLGPLRNPKIFFGLNEMGAFGLPSSLRQLTERLQDNLLYFGSNYLLFYLTLVALNVITNFFCISALVLVALGWVMLGRISSSSESDMVTIGKLSPISKNAAYMVMVVFTGLMALLMLGQLFGWSLWIAVIVTLAHASLRNSSDLSASQHQLEGDLEFGKKITSPSSL